VTVGETMQSHLVAGRDEFTELMVPPGHKFAYYEKSRLDPSSVQHLEQRTDSPVESWFSRWDGVILDVDGDDQAGARPSTCRPLTMPLRLVGHSVPISEGGASRVTSIEATALLLREVFPQHRKYLHPEYLDWEYLRSPSGRVIEANVDDEIGRCGHYAVVPQRWVIDGTPCIYALSLNTAVSGRSRGRGVFSALGRKVVAEARENGCTALVGVANSESSHGMVNSLGFDLVGSLKVLVIPPTAPRRARSFEVGAAGEMSGWLQEGGRSALPEFGAQRMWDADELSWRMADPAHDYRVLFSDDVMAVVHATSYLGVRVAVIVKVFVAGSAARVDVSPLATAACAALRTPLALYGGRNPRLRLRGIPVPTRIRPSPLNLIVKSLVEDMKPSELVPDCFEFLDFDAY
jgi:GNAT superfamily N-acetyltransferase